MKNLKERTLPNILKFNNAGRFLNETRKKHKLRHIDFCQLIGYTSIDCVKSLTHNLFRLKEDNCYLIKKNFKLTECETKYLFIISYYNFYQPKTKLEKDIAKKTIALYKSFCIKEKQK